MVLSAIINSVEPELHSSSYWQTLISSLTDMAEKERTGGWFQSFRYGILRSASPPIVGAYSA